MTSNSNNSQEFLERLSTITEENLHDENFGVSVLAREMGMSRSSLHRKVKGTLKISVSQFICQKRLKRALEILRKTSATVSETAYEVGFGSPVYFSKCFHDYYGYPPGQVGNRQEKPEPPIKNTNYKRLVKKWLTPAFIAALFIITFLLVAEIAPFQQLNSGEKKQDTKSIAVLPLKFNGTDSMRILSDGFVESVLNSLMDIDGIELRSKISVEQYRESTKSLVQISNELNADYIVEISGVGTGKILQLQVNLLDANSDNYLLREHFQVDIQHKNFLTLQNLIAGTIAEKTRTTLSNSEKQDLEKQLSDNNGALNFYYQGLNHLELSQQKNTLGLGNTWREELIKAKTSFEKAVKLDSGFVEAYNWLGSIYMYRLSYTDDLQLRSSYLDSGKVMAEKTVALFNGLKKDKNYYKAIDIIGSYFELKGNFEESTKYKEIVERNRIRTEANPGLVYAYNHDGEYCKSINSFFKYSNEYPEEISTKPDLVQMFSISLFYAGFPEVAKKYLRKNLEISDDSINYYTFLYLYDFYAGKFEKSITHANKLLTVSYPPIRQEFNPYNYLIFNYLMLRDYSHAFRYAQILENNKTKANPEVIAFIYSKNGQSRKASSLYNEAKKKYQDEIHHSSTRARMYFSYMNLAWTYSAMAKKEEAISYLKIINSHRITIPYWMIIMMEQWPLFDNIRNEPEFQKIKKEFEKKYQKVHKRVEKILRENGEIV